MRSWVFRHRLRLRAVYSPRLSPEAPRAPLPARAAQEPGEIRRGRRGLVLRPKAPPLV